MPHMPKLGSPSGLVTSSKWHLSDAFWNARVSVRQMGLFVPCADGPSVLCAVLNEEDDIEDLPGSDEVPDCLLVHARCWLYTENIITHEARAPLVAITAKGRCKCVVLLVVLCEMFAFEVQTGQRPTFRWIPSEVKFADDGSR